MNLVIALVIVAVYLVGSLNPAIVLSKLVYKKDIRELGSKNPGFTNFKRVFGGKLAYLVMLLDICKASLPCLILGLIFRNQFGDFHQGAAIAGLCAVLGHCYPIWYGFKGGKGFLAGETALWFIDWKVGLIAFVVLSLVLFTLHYMSLASILSILSAPIALAIIGYANVWTLVCCAFSSLLVIYRHKANISRLFSGTESKFYFGKKK